MNCAFTFKLYIINNETHTDFEVGKILSSTLENDDDKEYLERLFEEEFNSNCADFNNLLSKIYNLYNGQYELTILVNFTVIGKFDYFGEYDEVINYNYLITQDSKSNYFDK